MSEGNSRTRERPRWRSARSATAGLVSVAAATAFLATAGTAAQAVPSSSPVGAAGIVPPGSARTGALPASTAIQIEVALAPRDPAALSRYANEVATPGSPLYHAYIARGQFASLFGPTDATISSVYAALRARGLDPGAISSDHLSIPVTASAGQIESAFGVTMASYRLAGGGRGFANVNAPRLPANITSQVQAIIGLDNLVRMQPLAVAPSKGTLTVARTRTAAPDREATGGPQPCPAAKRLHHDGVLTADQLAFIYEFSDLYHAHHFGRGQSVGIVELGQPVRNSDISGFERCYRIHTKITYDKIDRFNSRGAGLEGTLDIETVASLAPTSNIVVYQSPNTLKDANDVYRTIVDQDRVRVISISFGLCESLQGRPLSNTATTLYLQGAVQGQTFVASSGDSGSEACLDEDGNPSELAVNFPASDPYVLSVGGTTLFQFGKPPNLVETVWNESSIGAGAGGGGKSIFFGQPQYQSSFGISSNAREVPDVSADADPETGYGIFFKGKWMPIGGTSAAAPLWASLLTLTNTECPGSPVGLVNFAMYFVASSAVTADVVNDIGVVSDNLNPNNNDYTGQGGGHYPAGNGYDMATGLGTPIAGALATQLCKATAAPRGYWLVSSGGHVYAEHAPGHGSFTHAGSRVVGIAAAHNDGYWIVTVKGRVKGFGIASKGSVRHPSAPIVGIAPDQSGHGYWLVASDGHVYAFGGAPFHGSARGVGRVVGIALDQQTGGYWIVTAGGRVVARDAGNFGSKRLSNVTGIAGDPKRQGYWVVTASGRVHAFGVPNFGGVFVRVGRTIGITGDPTFGGYFLATSNGHVAAINAVFHGDHAGANITGIAASH